MEKIATRKMMLLVEFSLLMFHVLVASQVIDVQLKAGEQKSLSELGVFPLYGNVLKFKIKSCKFFYMTLDVNKRKTVPYYIVPFFYGMYGLSLGFYGRYTGNKWYSYLGKRLIENEYPEVLASYDDKSMMVNCNTFTDLWLSFDKGQILFGRGSIIGTDTFLSYNDTCSYLVQDIRISGDASWLFDTAQRSNESSNRKKCEPAEFVHFQAMTCWTYKILNTLAGVTRIECACLCSLNIDCYSFRFDNITKTCEHVTGMIDSSFESAYYKIMF